MDVIWRQSPNYNARPPGKGVSLVVIHATAGKSDEGDLSWLCSPKSRVSYHYLVGRDGTAYQLVQESRRAWHAGVSRWLARENCNDFSLGVALSFHPDEGAYPQVQLDAAAELVADICKRRGLDGSRIVGHADISPGRKTDPYPAFPWGPFRLAVINRLHPPPPEIVIVPE